jgi:putative redox protein
MVRMSEKWTKITANWQGGMNFIGENQTGGHVQMGTFDVGLAGCTGMDIVSILQKKKVNLTDFKVEVEAKRADTYPMIWTDIHVKYLLWGNNIKTGDVEQAIRLSEEKYCSVSIMLGKSADIKSTYFINLPLDT